jgi:hypothetical protein
MKFKLNRKGVAELMKSEAMQTILTDVGMDISKIIL